MERVTQSSITWLETVQFSLMRRHCLYLLITSGRDSPVIQERTVQVNFVALIH